MSANSNIIFCCVARTLTGCVCHLTIRCSDDQILKAYLPMKPIQNTGTLARISPPQINVQTQLCPIREKLWGICSIYMLLQAPTRHFARSVVHSQWLLERERTDLWWELGLGLT